jgi:hypothetical protein
MLQLRGSTIRRRTLAVVATAGLLAGTSLVAGVGTSSAAPTAAQKFRLSAFTIDSSSPKVISSTGKRLRFFVFIASSSNSIATIEPRSARRGDRLSVGLSVPKESHDWDFTVKRSSIHLNASKGTGRIKTKHQLKRYGKFKLTLAPAGKAHRSCASSTGFTTTRKITLSGTPKFNSSSGKHGWGIVGANKMTIKATLVATFGTPDLDCHGGPVRSFCPRVGITVDDFSQSATLDASSRPGRAARLFGFRQVSLNSPRGAGRNDFLSGKLKPLSASTDAGGNVSIRLTGASKNLRGTATVASEGPPSNDICKQVSSNSYFGSSWTNGAKRLTFHGQIESRFSVPNNQEAQFEVTSPLQH